MARTDQIRDEKTLRVWLAGRSHEIALRIAYRTAMRVAPFVWGGEWHDTRLVSLVVARGLLTAGAASKSPTREIEDAARAATAHRDAYLEAVALAANDITDAAQGAANAAATVALAGSEGQNDAADAATRAVAGGIYAAEVAADDGNRLWEQIRDDARMLEAGEDCLDARLWSIPQPD
jgi:hypothetical protein